MRLCGDLFGLGDDKKEFRVFDFCFTLDFFNENPKGIETGIGASLGARLPASLPLDTRRTALLGMTMVAFMLPASSPAIAISESS